VQRRTAVSRRWRLAAAGAALLVATTLPTALAFAGNDQAGSYPGAHPVVRTENGRVAGSARSQVTEFLGIPYAKPPVGALRWKAPQPVKAWTGVRDATSFGGSCVQGTGWDPGYDKPTLTEDCLYVNVYRPSAGKARNLPVYVWNHGGGNVGGAGRDVDPTKFVVQSGQIFVTFNYRLGAMGYLATEALDAENPQGAAGNFGLLDQQAALKWVRENIKAFGGDAKNIALAGQSAGAGNNCAQLASPGAKGLFQKVIMESGGCSARTETDAQAQGAAFAVQAGCPDEAAQLACLRARTPAQVLAAQAVVRTSGGVWGNPVLPEDPATLLREHRLTTLPVLIGANSDESQQSVFSAYDYRGKPLTAGGYADLVRSTYGTNADRVLAAYPVGSAWSPTVAWGQVLSDQSACRTQTLRARMAADTKTYTYEFAEKDGPPFTSIWRLGTDYPFGATHVNEMGYLFDYLGTALPVNRDQVDLSTQMITYWSTFAARGNPNAAYSPNWPSYRAGGAIMQLKAPGYGTVPASVVSDQHSCALWNEIAPLV
jgi:para-nitrobenzyl esterase